MDIHAPSFRRRAMRTFRERGIAGVVERVGPVLGRMRGTLKSRPWRRRRRVTAVLLAGHRAEMTDLIERALANRTRRWSRWLNEMIVITNGGADPEPPPSFVQGVRVRHYHFHNARPSVLANAGIALAHTEGVVFLDPMSAPLTSAFLFMVHTALNHGADVLCSVEDPPEASSLNGSRKAKRSPSVEEAQDGLAAVERLLAEISDLSTVAFRRGPLIYLGLFHPEDGEAYVTQALLRLWRTGAGFWAVRPSEPGSLVMMPRVKALPPKIDDAERPTRVLYLVNGTDVRGGIRIVFEHCNRLRARGIEAIVASFDEPIQTWFPDLNAPLVGVRDLPPADVAVATYWTTADYVSKLNCARFYFIQHDEALFEQDEEWTRLVRETYHLPLDFITISSWLVDLITSESGRKPVLVPNGINTQMFFPEPAYPKGPRSRVLVEGSKNIFWKGMDEAKRALDGFDVEVWTLGDTGIDGDRNFINPPQAELRRIYSSCDVLLKTSWYEGMPLPHMEAMACGCALITTDVPGVRDYCFDGQNCLTVAPRDVEAMRAVLGRLLTEPGLREKLISNALDTAGGFTWDDKIDLLARTYSDAARDARRRFASMLAASERTGA